MTNQESSKPWLLAIPCLLALLIYVFPSFVRPVLPGLDNSWMYAINFAAANGLTFGRDLTFTYGPLGYLLMPLSVGTNLYWGALFQTAAYLLFFGQIFYVITKNQTPPAKIIIFCGLFGFIANYFSLSTDVVLLFIMTIFFYLAMTATTLRRRLIFIAAGAAIAAAGAFFKFNIGLAGLGTVVIFCGYLAYERAKSTKELLLVATITYAVTLVVLSSLLIGSFWAAIDYFRYSFILADGHSAAMAWAENYAPHYKNLVYGDEVTTALLLIAGFLASLLILRKNGEKSHYILLISLASLFLAFKQGYVRQGGEGHYGFFLCFSLGILATTLLTTKATAVWNWLLAITIIATFINGGIPTTYGLAPPKTALNGRQGFSNFWDFCQLPETVARSEKLSLAAAEAARLPKDVEATLAQKSSDWKKLFTFDSVPTEFAPLYANNLNWRPSPFLQFYALYSPSLDQKTATHFASTNKPDYILVGWSCVDFRNPITDAPLTWKSILANYQLAGLLPNQLLLQTRKIPVHKRELLVAKVPLNFERWLVVPDSKDLVFAKSRLRLTAYGWLRKFLFRIPPVNLAVEYENGVVNLVRISPENLGSGLLVNYLPLNLQYFGAFCEGQPLPRVRHIQFTGPGLEYYTAKDELVWFKIAR